MIDPQNKPPSTSLAVAALFFALLFLILGAAIVAVAVGWIPVHPGRSDAPPWVVCVVGVLFMVGGFLPLLAHLNRQSGLSLLFDMAFVLLLTLIFNRAAFRAGTRQFLERTSHRMRSGFVFSLNAAQHGTIPESYGRTVFGTGAAALDLLALVIAVQWIRSKREV